MGLGTTRESSGGCLEPFFVPFKAHDYHDDDFYLPHIDKPDGVFCGGLLFMRFRVRIVPFAAMGKIARGKSNSGADAARCGGRRRAGRVPEATTVRSTAGGSSSGPAGARCGRARSAGGVPQATTVRSTAGGSSSGPAGPRCGRARRAGGVPQAGPADKAAPASDAGVKRKPGGIVHKLRRMLYL
jgi:hypothetical protein